MDIQRGPLYSLTYFCQGKSMEELRQSLFYTTMELEQTRIAVQEELRKRDQQFIQLKTLLSKAMRDKDEAQEKCQALFLEKLMLHQQQQQQQQQQVLGGAPLSGVSSIDDEQQQKQQQNNRRGIDSNNGFSSSDCEESIVSSPVIELQQLQQEQEATVLELVPDRPLPEKGKLLQAVMKAGPLLQTLLLAGPLPQWRHPPPPLESFEIPPVTIPSPPQLLHQDSFISGCNNSDNSGKVNRKRGLYEYDGSSDLPSETEYQRLVLP